MWHARIDSLTDNRVHRFALLRNEAPIPYSDVLALWRDDASFRSYFIALLADSPFEAYRWETPCVTSATRAREFEFVLLRSDSLSRPVDTTAFAAHFDTDAEVVTFPNLGRDAVMVVPCPIGDVSLYGHLASFIRNAPESQLHQLWQSVAVAMNQRVCERPVWLSTAGMGVSWLHVRLDDRPKYYGYLPFRQVV
ncbi:MAG TPA: hypothetical protein VMM76_08875 [Pirellulaceae bacterium]|nr:hypothetical protein [Pirellulaceae bacterium]